MKKILGLFIFSAVLFSCKKNVLDIPPQDRVSEDAVWADENLIKAYQNSLYNAIPHGFFIHMYSKYTDEAYNAAPCCGADLFKLNNFTPDNIANAGRLNDFWGTNSGYMYYWDYAYQNIRKVNVFLEKMADPGALQFSDKAKLVAEAKFLRAFIYFNLIERFGGVPIVTQSYELKDFGTVTFKRNTFDENVAFIQKDIDEALPNLPTKYPSTDGNYGRATKDAAYALLSRLYLYAASPLFNPTHDNAKWQKAADAAAVFTENADRGYSLYPDYSKLFNQPSGASQNEFILTRNFTTTNGHQAPMHNLGRRYGAYGGWWASNGPSQNLVDDYDMKTTGLPAFTWTGNNTKTVNLGSGYDPNRPYKDRDPRFYATVIHDSAVYHGDMWEMWVEANGDKRGFDSWRQSSDNPRSGYILRKFMPEEGPINWQTFYTIPWPYFRLAEIYLNYAEAKFELGDEAKAREYINKVRARVGMPPIPNTVTGNALKERLYNERRIELAFENHRFFDIRRWKIANIIENRPIFGMDILKNLTTGATTYTPVQLLVKNAYQDKMNLLPIQTAELQRNPQLTQTTGW